MDDSRERDQFARITLHSRVEHDRLLVEQYESGLVFRRTQIEDGRHELGKLDERLGA
ncbi:hypothetical protein DFR70_105440 [Nocardia tenerifensis]|uniref:Uncharacterized protein n=1 Tax=Nocardia tenerifensis TaxID=228006 RepID=A0A318KPI2_9NOCA|nr:hypothetical protein [Nocardia tenerifensis]PXX64255.1 hypothetical protein DFR70_105440 [Nocardia tenerifensis]